MAGRDEAERRERGMGGAGPGLVRPILVFYGFGVLFVAIGALLALASNILLVVFAGVLVAVLLSDATRRVQRWLPMPRSAALALVVVAAAIVLGLGGWLLAPGVVEQANELMNAIPRALQRLQDTLRRYGLLQNLMGSLPSPETVASYASSMLARAGVIFSGLLGAVAGAVIIIFIAIYFAARPSSYLDGIVALVPLHRRQRAREVLDEIDRTLSLWLLGKLLSMVIVGVATAFGLAMLEVPLALVLGILAGLFDFIPYIGPVLAGVPAVLIAFAESPTLALYVILLFIALQAAEGYLLLPLIERRTVSLPPALTITMQTLLGSFFGLAGVALATPLTAVLAVLVAMLYVRDVLGDEVKMPGEH